MVELIGNEQWSNEPKRTQVFYATHTKNNDSTAAEWLRQSYMHRSFISFSFGGKWIEDFNLIATIDGDRLQRTASASHEDLVSSYDVLDGQFYWGTRFQPNQLELVLATDGMTENELDEFKNWFCGGVTRELILAEHPNRAIMARVGQTSNISMLPFEEKTTVKIAGSDYNTSTTIYRGQIGMVFIMDEPFWYSKVNLFGRLEQNKWVDVWENANGTEVHYYEDADALKVIKEDNLPIAEAFTEHGFIVGNSIGVDIDFTIAGTATVAQQTREDPIRENGIAVAGANNDNVDYNQAFGYTAGGRILDLSQTGMNLSVVPKYLYYAGTAPTTPTLTFMFTPELDENYYIDSPRNIFTNSETPYDMLVLEGKEKKLFKFSLPGAYYGYNQAIDLFKNPPITNIESNSTTMCDLPRLRELIRGTITHKYARAWAIAVTDYFNINTFDSDTACRLMSYFITDRNDHEKFLSTEVTFYGKIGKNIGKIGYNIPNNDFNISDWEFYSITNTMLEENVGDMIKSDYLILNERNHPDENGWIRSWKNDNDITRSYSYKLYYIGKNNESILQHLQVIYQYMYY